MNHAAAFLLLLSFSATVSAQPTTGEYLRTNPKFQQAFREVTQKPAGSVVRIQCGGTTTCLGVVVSGDGWVLTKANDLKGKITCVLGDGRELAAKLVGVHEEHDLAMLKINAVGLKPIEWSTSASAWAGTWVASVGVGDNPLAVGIVSVATRKVNEAYLGVLVDESPRGVIVVGVLQKGAAMNAGVQPGDRVTHINRRSIRDAETFAQLLAGQRPGDTLTMTVQRGDAVHEFKARLQSRNEVGGFRADFQNRLGSELSSRRGGYTIVLQHDTVVRPEDCGSPLVDLQGRVIGLNISRASRVETWAIPAEVVRPLLADLKAGRYPPPTKKAAN